MPGTWTWLGSPVLILGLLLIIRGENRRYALSQAQEAPKGASQDQEQGGEAQAQTGLLVNGAKGADHDGGGGDDDGALEGVRLQV